MPEYTDEHARAGIDAPLPRIECFENQFKNYEITISIPEYTSICPKSRLPDFGTITIWYIPDRWCMELKSLKTYILAYRTLGIFYENAVNRILRDLIQASKPMKAIVTGEFNVRGGMKSTIEASYDRNVPHKPCLVGGVEGHSMKRIYLSRKPRPVAGEFHSRDSKQKRTKK